MSRVGVYPGTFDPVTYGHLDIMCRALKVVDHLIVAVAEENVKTPLFSLSERIHLAKESIHKMLPGANVTVQNFHGLLVNFCTQVNASLIIRGLRAVSDFEFEFQLACVNNKLGPDIETILIPASDNTHFISSRFVREVARLGGDMRAFVPEHVAAALVEAYAQTTPHG